jgi:microcin C transport system substrate-binding protein
MARPFAFHTLVLVLVVLLPGGWQRLPNIEEESYRARIIGAVEDSTDVPAPLGGPGFEKIAADNGWTTAAIADEDYQYVADTNALKGGTITIGLEAFPLTFRAYGKNENTTVTRSVYNMVYEGLLTTNPLDLEFLPSLASHWRIGPDGRTYYFRINPAARFSDGHPVTSEDVIATYRLGSDPGILSASTNAFFEEFETPVALSRYIVAVRSKSLNWKNLLYFSGTPILPAHVIGRISGEEYLRRYQYAMPPGTGPYIVREKDIRKGRSVTLRRRIDWWQKNEPQMKGEFNFDAIRMIVIADPEAAARQFRSGEIDLSLSRTVESWIAGSDIDEVRRGLIAIQYIHTRYPSGFAGLAFNTKREPFDDIRVRQAIGLLFDREHILGKDVSRFDLTNSIYPGSEYENPNNARREYDPAGAVQLLKEAGYTSRNDEGILVRNGKPLVIEMLVYGGQQYLTRILQTDLAQVGIRVEPKVVDPSVWFSMLKEQNYQMAHMSWGGLLFPNPITSFHSTLADRLPSNNITSFRDARVDSLAEREQRTFDPVERRKILREIDSIFSSSYHYAYSWHASNDRLVYRNRFGMPRHVISRIGDWRDILSLWWVDPVRHKRLQAAQRDRSINLDRPEPSSYFWLQWSMERRNQQGE